MAPFRRPGLADDDSEERPQLTQRAYSLHPYHMNIPVPAKDGDESVISGLSAQSDLDSVYLESSPNEDNKEILFQQNQLLPSDKNVSSKRLDELDSAERKPKGSSPLLMPFNDENDEEDNWEDLVFKATNQYKIEGQRKSNSDETFDVVVEEMARPRHKQKKQKSKKKVSPEKKQRDDSERTSSKKKSKKNKKEKKDKEKSSKKKKAVQVESRDIEGETKKKKKGFSFVPEFLKSPKKKKGAIQPQ